MSSSLPPTDPTAAGSAPLCRKLELSGNKMIELKFIAGLAMQCVACSLVALTAIPSLLKRGGYCAGGSLVKQ